MNNFEHKLNYSAIMSSLNCNSQAKHARTKTCESFTTI